jgi:transposase
MNYAQINQRYLCGIDLHANSMYLKILDREGQVLYKRNMPNNFALFKQILTPFLPDIAVGVESTFNYYWLYDGCVEAGVPFYLGHAAYMKAIAGNKQKNDPLDAETIVPPEGNIEDNNCFAIHRGEKRKPRCRKKPGPPCG